MEHNPPIPADSSSVPVIPLPIALYVSDGLIFELYDGGRSRRRFPFDGRPWFPQGKTLLKQILTMAALF
jgi:hypothetical protein